MEDVKPQGINRVHVLFSEGEKKKSKNQSSENNVWRQAESQLF